MSPIFYPGRTFLLPKGSQITSHLRIILTKQEGNPEKIVMVNLTTKRSGSDETVVLDIGDHPFIKHPTVVFYNDARFTEVASLRGIMGTNVFSFCDDFKEDVLIKIKKGLLLSPHTPIKIKNYCKIRFTELS